MSKLVLVTGGARSGKSRFAEDIAHNFGGNLTYLATSRIWDEETRSRVEKHKERRGSEWNTVEEPTELSKSLKSIEESCDAVLIDCLTLWITNLMIEENPPEKADRGSIISEVEKLISVIAEMEAPVIIVTNETGMGIVPENGLARLFRDIAGEANQLIAKEADEVWFVISGIPMKIKG